ncbi:MAG: type II toxin-antitoxin system prevent-host-death family antitoxin [Anaerolineae bacterium]
MTVKIISVSEVRQKLKDVLFTLEATGEPYFITQYSRPKAVLVRYEDYNALVEQVAEEHPRIVRRPDISGGEPIIRGTRVSVRHIVERVQAGQSVDDILAALPHLTVSQVHDALSYYYDHQAEIDRQIEESRPEQVIAEQGLKVEKVAEGVAVVRAPS